MNKTEMLKILRLLSAMESAMLCNKQTMPDYLFEEIDNIKVLDYNLEQLKDWLQPNPKVDKIWKNSTITQRE